MEVHLGKVLYAKESTKEADGGDPFLYLIFSFLSGVFETGALTAGSIKFGLHIGLTLVLAYQIGCLLRNPIRLSRHAATCALCFSLLLLPFYYVSIWVLLIAVTLASAGIQSSRDCFLPKMDSVSIRTKRLVRVAGFICGVLGGTTIGLSILIYAAAASCLVVLPIVIRQAPKIPWLTLNKQLGSDNFGWIMLLHQTHYFAYAYVLLVILIAVENTNLGGFTLINSIKASGWFAFGWVSYISGKSLLKKLLRMSSLQAAIIGHAWVFICLIFMATFLDHPIILGLAWVLGGFGGGSVYAIKDLAKTIGCKVDIELWEHYGHVAGVSISLISVLFFPRFLPLSFLAAMIAAVSTILLLLRTTAIHSK